jgi:hypothetical protein
MRGLRGRRGWSNAYETIEDAYTKVFEYVEMYYNSKRLHSSLDYQSPMSYEKKVLLLFNPREFCVRLIQAISSSLPILFEMTLLTINLMTMAFIEAFHVVCSFIITG